MEELNILAGFVEQFKLEDAGDEVCTAAKACVLETVALSLGAVNNPMFQHIKEVYTAYDGTRLSAGNPGLLWGSGECAVLRTAVFLNAMMGHILELDDVHTKSKTHIGTVVIPAAWCLAAYMRKTGKDLLEAVICGYEVMARIGMGFGVSSHRNKGWHVTGTAGTFGAAAACAKLLDFNREQILAALGLAGTQSSSTWAFLADGATNKVLHPARAAASGLESCMLVQGGMRGSARILDAPDGGIFPMMSDGYDYSLLSAGLGTVYEILNMDKKPYPCCRSTHCAIDGAIALRQAHGIRTEEIRSVEVATYLVGVKQCGLTESSKTPKQPTEAKFSTPYTVACALISGNVGLSDFELEAIDREELKALASRVHVSAEEHFTDKYPEHWGCRVEIKMENGCVYTKEVEDASGSVAAPLTYSQILSKAHACCGAYDRGWRDRLFRELMELERLEKLPQLQGNT